MKFSTRAEYAIRALVDLALHHDKKQPLKLNLIAERQDISLKYLEQLFIPLRKAGLVRGMRGPIGGYALARPPQKIKVKDILDILDILDDHLCDQDNTDDTPDQSNRFLIQELQRRITRAIRDVLDTITLEELCQRQIHVLQQLQSLRTFEAPAPLLPLRPQLRPN